ncbi:glycosyltransferase family 2 protein [Aquabacter sp. CN5-332]|uniref:glycosyltransferase family 2 protein n=1 Tax=Aquabacter sp. CN5-332 TaxID=3156608 RepID=UPI0032B618A8
MPAVSVCIPAYRQVAALEQALDSLVVQRFTNYDVVITDDSPDSEVEALIRTYDFGGRLRYFRNPHPLGAPRNWDEAIRLSHAPLIKMLHPHDRFAHPDALGRFVALMDENPDCLLGFAASRVEDEAGQTSLNAADPAQLADLKRRPERLLLGDVIGSASAAIRRRAPPLEYDPRLTRLVDVDLHLRALRLNPRLAYLEEPLTLISTEPPPSTPEDRTLEVREALVIFQKVFDQLHDDPDAALYWWRMLKRHKVRSFKQLVRLGEPPPALAAYFRRLYACPPRDGERSLADALTAPFRLAWRPIHTLFKS